MSTTTLWEKIVLNLLSNAYKFTFEGEVRVSLRPFPDGRAAEFEVSDTGAGIPDHELPRVFERFHRVEGARGRTHEGTGIGLALVQELVRLHGGSISAESRIGKGSAFTVRIPFGSAHLPPGRIGSNSDAPESMRTGAYAEGALPWLPDADVEPAVLAEPAPAPLQTSENGARPKVLLADDNADMREYLRRLLAPRYDVQTVSNGVEALKSVQSHAPDLVLSDIMMPDLNGFALIERLRANPATAATPVILLSARAGEEAKVEGIAAGADDYLIKPFSARELLARVETHVKLAEVRRRAAAEVRESEFRFRRLFEANTFGVAFCDFEGRVLDANESYLRIVGYSQEDLAAGLVRWDRMTPPEFTEANARGHRELRERGVGAPFEKEYVRKDGSRVSVLIGGALLAEPWEAQDTYATFCIDITERKKIEAQLLRTQKLESLGVLAGGVAHDFNNLLVGILGNTSLALDTTPPSSPIRTLLLDASNAAQRAADLTRQLLAYAGKGRFIVDMIDVSALIREIITLIQSSIPRNVQLRLDLEDGLPSVEVDVTQIQQLLMNLIINGGEAMGDRNGSVTVATGVQQIDEHYLRAVQGSDDLSEGDYVFIEVQDTGSGMDQETLNKIFDPFFTTKFMGRGLGLAAALGIIRGHHGAIKVYSQPGKGSTFKVLLPARSHASVTIPSSSTHMNLEGEGTVLVVDDEETVRRTAKTALQRYGYSVLLAEHGQQGLDLFREFHKSIVAVVLDMTMPVMGGEEALRRMKEAAPSVPVILSSGFNEVEAVRRFTGKGLAGFIQKPYTARALAEKLVEIRERGESLQPSTS